MSIEATDSNMSMNDLEEATRFNVISLSKYWREKGRDVVNFAIGVNAYDYSPSSFVYYGQLFEKSCNILVMDMNESKGNLGIDSIYLIKPTATSDPITVVCIAGSEEDIRMFKENYFKLYDVEYTGEIILINDLTMWLQKHYKYSSVNIAIVTSNVDDYYRLIRKSFGYEGDTDPAEDMEDFCDNSKEEIRGCVHHKPCWKLPKLIKAWIWRVWYGPKPPKKPENPKEDTETSDTSSVESGLDSYVEASISVLSNGVIYTYWLIVPGAKLDLSDFDDLFDYVYLDLDTRYPIDMIYPTNTEKFNISPFLFYLDNEDISTYTVSRLTNIFSNYLTIDAYCSKLVCSEHGHDKNKHAWDTRINTYAPIGGSRYEKRGCMYPLDLSVVFESIALLTEIRMSSDVKKKVVLEEDNE